MSERPGGRESERGPSGPLRSSQERGTSTLRIRWLGRVPYREAWALQRAMHASSPDDHLLLLADPHVYTRG